MGEHFQDIRQSTLAALAFLIQICPSVAALTVFPVQWGSSSDIMVALLLSGCQPQEEVPDSELSRELAVVMAHPQLPWCFPTFLNCPL